MILEIDEKMRDKLKELLMSRYEWKIQFWNTLVLGTKSIIK